MLYIEHDVIENVFRIPLWKTLNQPKSSTSLSNFKWRFISGRYKENFPLFVHELLSASSTSCRSWFLVSRGRCSYKAARSTLSHWTSTHQHSPSAGCFSRSAVISQTIILSLMLWFVFFRLVWETAVSASLQSWSSVLKGKSRAGILGFILLHLLLQVSGQCLYCNFRKLFLGGGGERL